MGRLGYAIYAQTAAGKSVATAVVDALAPICLAQFQKSPDFVLKQGEFTKLAAGDRQALCKRAVGRRCPAVTLPISRWPQPALC